MVCVCDNCVRQWQTLGIELAPNSVDEIKQAYRDAMKIWHPDRFESDSRLRVKTEAFFKKIQIAYQELSEHFVQTEANDKGFVAGWSAAEASKLRSMKGCLIPPSIPKNLELLIRQHAGIQSSDNLVLIANLAPSSKDIYSEFLVITEKNVFVKDTFTKASLLRNDLNLEASGLEDHRRNGNLGFWQRTQEAVSGTQQKFSLRLFHMSGVHFHTISTPIDDSVKEIVWKLLKRKG